MRKMLFITLLMGGLCTTVSVAKAQERLPEYSAGREVHTRKIEHHVVFYCGGSALVPER